MDVTGSIIYSYVLTGLLIGGLIIATWVRAVRVNRALACQDTAAQP